MDNAVILEHTKSCLLKGFWVCLRTSLPALLMRQRVGVSACVPY